MTINPPYATHSRINLRAFSSYPYPIEIDLNYFYAFLAMLSNYPVGSLPKLSKKQIGILGLVSPSSKILP